MRITLIAALALLLTACDTLNKSQYLVPTYSDGATQEAALAKKTLRSVSNQFNLQDQTWSSHVPETIAYYSQQNSSIPLQLGARIAPEGIVIDLMHFHPGVSESKEYKAAKAALESALGANFGIRWQELPYEKRIPLPMPSDKSGASSAP